MARKKCQNLSRSKESMKESCLVRGVRAQANCKGDMHTREGNGKFVIYKGFAQISNSTKE